MRSPATTLGLALLLLVVLPAAARATDAELQLGSGDDFVVKDSGSGDLLRVDEPTGKLQGVGGSDHQGDVWYDDGSGTTRLAPGIAGQYLQTLGAGANPQWATPGSAPVPSNVIFQYVGQVEASAVDDGEVTAANLTSTGQAGWVRYLSTTSISDKTYLRGKFLKTSSVSSIAIYAYMWSIGGNSASCNVIVGGQSNFVSVNSAGPVWASPNYIDVSGLSDGVVYDITVQLRTSNGSNPARMGTLFLLGS